MAKKQPIKRRKPKARRKDSSIRLRTTSSQKEVLETAAAAAGLSLSGWLLATGLQAAASQKGAGGGE